MRVVCHNIDPRTGSSYLTVKTGVKLSYAYIICFKYYILRQKWPSHQDENVDPARVYKQFNIIYPSGYQMLIHSFFNHLINIFNSFESVGI